MAKISGTSGEVRFGTAKNISGATHAASVVTITASSHGFADKDRVLVEGVVGMTDLNGNSYTIDYTSSNIFNVDQTTAQSYTSGGTVQKIYDITGYNIDINLDVIDITDSNVTTTKEFISNVFKEASGTFDVFIEGATNVPSKGESVAIELDIDGTLSYSGTGFITSEAMSLDVVANEVVKATYSFQTTGTVTQATS